MNCSTKICDLKYYPGLSVVSTGLAVAGFASPRGIKFGFLDPDAAAAPSFFNIRKYFRFIDSSRLSWNF